MIKNANSELSCLFVDDPNPSEYHPSLVDVVKPIGASDAIANNSAFYNTFSCIRIVNMRKGFSRIVRSADDENVAITEYRDISPGDFANIITPGYLEWRDKREVIPVTKEYVEHRVIDGVKVDRYFSYTWLFHSMKRGDPVYIDRVRALFKHFTEGPPITYFEPDWGVKTTNMLHVVCTTDPWYKKRAVLRKKLGLSDDVDLPKSWDQWLHCQPRDLSIVGAWAGIGKTFNSFITNIRQMYPGKVVFIRAWHSHQNAYPHLDIVLYFRDKEFTAVKWINKKGELIWCLPSRGTDRKRIKNAWKWGNVDITCVANVNGAFKDVLKYITGELKGGKSDNTNAAVWFFGKQAFGISRSKDNYDKAGNFISHTSGFGELVWHNYPEYIPSFTEQSKTPEGGFAEFNPIPSSNSNLELVKTCVYPAVPAYLFGKKEFRADRPPPLVVKQLEFLASICKPLELVRKVPVDDDLDDAGPEPIDYGDFGDDVYGCIYVLIEKDDEDDGDRYCRDPLSKMKDILGDILSVEDDDDDEDDFGYNLDDWDD